MDTVNEKITTADDGDATVNERLSTGGPGPEGQADTVVERLSGAEPAPAPEDDSDDEAEADAPTSKRGKASA